MRSYLVFVGAKDDQNRLQEVREMQFLMKSLFYQEVDTTVVIVPEIDNKTYIGKGRLENLRNLLSTVEFETIVFSVDFSPRQFNYIQDFFPNHKILDRSALILEIFASIAKSRESKVQVRMTQLKRELSQIIGSKTNLDQQGGGMKNKGSGEKDLEIKRRKIAREIDFLKKELDEIFLKRETQKKSRVKNNIPVVTMLGYTNAGKSSLLNQLLMLSGGRKDKQVEAADRYFTSLDVAARKISLSRGTSFILIDTVGFIANLSEELKRAFYSTLMEIKNSDLLLIVVDASDNNMISHFSTIMEVLKDLKVLEIQALLIFNKADQIDETRKNDIIKTFGEDEVIFTSTLEEDSLRKLLFRLETILFSDYQEVTIFLTYSDLGMLDFFKKKYVTYNQMENESGIVLTIYAPKSDIEYFEPYLL